MAREGTKAKHLITAALGQAGRAALDFVFPPTCPVSDAPVDAPGHLAPEAWATLTFITAPLCARCGVPFAFDPGDGMECAACVARPPVVVRARSVLVYDDVSRDLVLQLKHAARTDGLVTFANWMAAAFAHGSTDASADEGLAAHIRIVPIPLHPARLRARRFNQSALLARALAQRAGGVFDPDTLKRVRATPTQAGKSAKGRARNVAGAFKVREKRRAGLRGAHVLLVDDVFTTGATLDAAARALLAGGAARVDAVTLARVVRSRDVTI